MHHFAIVDEVDNILIDEARTPLIISGAPEQAAELYVRFAKLAPMMTPGKTPEGMDPRTKKEFVADFDYEFDEKHKTVSVTEQGVEKAERFLGIDHLYRAENGQLVNHLIQSLKAESLYKRDVDYAVIDGEVKIIDEFTGRILEGRRWSEGLHQAVEAKEGVRDPGGEPDARDDHAAELLPHVRQARRHDGHGAHRGDRVHEDLQAAGRRRSRRTGRWSAPTATTRSTRPRTASGRAVVREIEERHANGQPVLVGTISVEVSELLGASCRKRGIPHTVLNAKPEHAEREGEIVAEAGQPGAVTIATNMAGRGVDIKLGGNPEHLTRARARASSASRPATRTTTSATPRCCRRSRRASRRTASKVVEAGGLFIFGTERHESRRIDNQLRGRSGRQGDPGESRFFLSAEDDLVRLFAGDRIYRILDRLGAVDEEGNEEPIEAEDALQADREGAEEGRGAELPHPQARARVRRRHERAARIVYAYRDEVLEGQRHGRAGARGDRRRDRADGRGVHARRLRRGLGPRRAVRRARRDLPVGFDARRPRPRAARPRASSSSCSPTTR